MSWIQNPAIDVLTGKLICRQPSRTSQAMRDEADINRIVATFLKTGALPLTTRVPQYGDAASLPDLQAALAAGQRAKQLYASLPQQVRDETGGDYTRLESWLHDSRNTELAIKLGLLNKPKPVSTSSTSTPSISSTSTSSISSTSIPSTSTSSTSTPSTNAPK